MLIADKVRNRKDFETLHLGSHPNSRVLAQYFANWLRALGVDETRYRALRYMLATR
ncbi:MULTISPECIES: hypothetical protein [unclassified Lysobacter]|uniref:hypothetical protein n=1 Tax=unclassified Lysobacter TaxID=2635362 RepID=UPI001BEB7681|nr:MULTISPECIES: hypothetical protein [unclassified Lysobacter]MBT2747517.1 hypothetical protein [Lysobacter sp. ISL-42]MBT2752340.1 hypothetical protein [Lysobacter sp. ISL-50]MBT2776241.1 hypothetical protein [Lysobacter sp. ISL-54]MBT2784090.1 hypothetical protein [Lysobacter sp. ISL-52]